MSADPRQDLIDAVRAEAERVLLPVARALTRWLDHPARLVLTYVAIATALMLGCVWSVTHP